MYDHFGYLDSASDFLLLKSVGHVQCSAKKELCKLGVLRSTSRNWVGISGALLVNKGKMFFPESSPPSSSCSEEVSCLVMEVKILSWLGSTRGCLRGHWGQNS